jgi:lysozyme family protein
MVGPSTTADERRTLRRRLLAGIALLVAASGGLVALQAGASLAEAAVATLLGLVVGLGVIWFLNRLGKEMSRQA